MLADYRRCWRNPEMIHGSCSDYRAGATVDMEHDQADIDTKVACPTLAFWGANGMMHKLFDIERNGASAVRTCAPLHCPAAISSSICCRRRRLGCLASSCLLIPAKPTKRRRGAENQRRKQKRAKRREGADMS